MALEIREIAIRMRVGEGDGCGDGGPGDEPGGDEPGGDGGADREKIVEECVRRVLQALKATRER